MSWLYLVLAGVLETVWAGFMKVSDGFSKLSYSVLTIIFMVLSFFFLIKATKELPISIAYPVWTGIGAVGSIIVGILIFHDKLNLSSIFFICLLVIGIIGLKITS